MQQTQTILDVPWIEAPPAETVEAAPPPVEETPAGSAPTRSMSIPLWIFGAALFTAWLIASVVFITIPHGYILIAIFGLLSVIATILSFPAAPTSYLGEHLDAPTRIAINHTGICVTGQCTPSRNTLTGRQ